MTHLSPPSLPVAEGGHPAIPAHEMPPKCLEQRSPTGGPRAQRSPPQGWQAGGGCQSGQASVRTSSFAHSRSLEQEEGEELEGVGWTPWFPRGGRGHDERLFLGNSPVVCAALTPRRAPLRRTTAPLQESEPQHGTPCRQKLEKTRGRGARTGAWGSERAARSGDGPSARR